MGGIGRDVLVGGPDADSFVFTITFLTDPNNPTNLIPVPDTGVGRSHRDVVVDFQEGVDHLNLQGFGIHKFIGTDPFSDTGADQARYEIEDGGTIVQMRGTSILTPQVFDGEIKLVGVHHLSASDFQLLA